MDMEKLRKAVAALKSAQMDSYFVESDKAVIRLDIAIDKFLNEFAWMDFNETD